MLCLSKKTEYALVALGYLSEQNQRVASSREIADARAIPAAMLMNILKNLQNHGVLQSTRGVKGGYRIASDLRQMSLYDFIAIVDCAGHAAPDGNCGCMEHTLDQAYNPLIARLEGSQGPVQALQIKLVQFLRDIRVADVVLPGRRIDVPLEHLKSKNNRKHRSIEHVHSID